MGISTFSYNNDPTIVEASRIVIRVGCMPIRYVLRKLDGKYVTHEEVVQLEGNVWTHQSFNHGHYFDFHCEDNISGTTPEEAFQDAVKDFTDRCGRL